MNSLLVNKSYSATIKFSPTKTCFVYVPDSCLRETIEIHIFKLIFGDSSEAFISCLAYRASNDSEFQILINAKFAEKLGLKEKEKVCLQEQLSSIPAVQDLILEPLSTDDWEVLELNTRHIEQVLMSQIRVVWQNQIFPVWVNNSVLYVKVVQTRPENQPVLLVEFTEIHVVPKKRNDSEHSPALTSDSQTPEKKTQHHLQFQHLRSNPKTSPLDATSYKDAERDIANSFHDDTKSTVARAISLFSSFFPTSFEEKSQSFDDSFIEFVPVNIDLTLHVIPFSRHNVKPLPVVVQATTVFITAETYIALYGAEDIPPCFVATLQKIPFPESMREKKTNGLQIQKSIKDFANELQSNKSKEDHKSKKSGLIVNEERQPPFDSVCVTVMVVHSAEEDEFNLPASLFYTKNSVVVPRELKKGLNLEVSSLIHLVGVQMKPFQFSTVILHPTSFLPETVTNDILLTNFEKWAFGFNRQSSTFVLSDGTLISLRLFGTKYNFFISLKENSSQTFNSSSSSTSSTSPNNSDVEQRKPVTTEPKYGFLNFKNIQEIQITPGILMCMSILVDRPYLEKHNNLYPEVLALHLDTLGGVNELAEKALENLEFWLKLRPLSFISTNPFTFSGCMLICGPKGVGKSSLAQALCKKLSKFPYHVFYKVVHCLPLKGKRIDTIAKKWDEILTESVHSHPSIILFEDLDYIAGCPVSHEQEVGPDGIYFCNIVQVFIHLLKKLNDCDGKVAVIVTSQSTHTLHPNLVKTKGRHIFQTVVEVKPPNANQRKDILCSLIHSKTHISLKTVDSVNWKRIASQTEGYVAQDLDALVDRATHAAWVRMAKMQKESEITLNSEDFEMALEGQVPSALRGIPLQVHDHKTWNDVGGLTEVKKVVQQIIMWPIKYKQIFKNYLLKPQSNILLYGAPGTGKTLLAGVIANECSLNFISIKGPELLSKYIGASEQAVRDLFKRASAARPCILFFDEFDSIAPRRGHDSTGVTDRVVNQLLTQLDGVETLEGVHVIAASNRPELIDPALLRPGRLDKCLLCPLPNEKERLEILKCLSSKLSIADDVDLESIASMTEHFSGADIQALLYTANLEAFHETQSDATRRYSTSSEDVTYSIASDKLLFMPTIKKGLSIPTYEDGQKILQEVSVIKENFCGIIERRGSQRHSTLSILISQKNLLKVIEGMKPSVSSKERMRYENVFKKFQGSLSGDTDSSLLANIKRVTLA